VANTSWIIIQRNTEKSFVHRAGCRYQTEKVCVAGNVRELQPLYRTRRYNGQTPLHYKKLISFLTVSPIHPHPLNAQLDEVEKAAVVKALQLITETFPKQRMNWDDEGKFVSGMEKYGL